MSRSIGTIGIIALAGFASAASGTGILMPKDPAVPPLAIKHQRVDIDIRDGVATAHLEQVFRNSVDRDLEAVYIFPVPAAASIDDFAMYIDGKRLSGELVTRDKARRIYEDIVRRLKDPGLLEYIGGNLFRVSVYPVPRNGEQRIEISYSQTLEYDAGLFRFVYPLRTGEQASRTLEDFTVRLRLASKQPIRTIYSPSHDAGISRKGDHEATIGFEEERSLLDRDFVLYYGVSEKEFGLNLMTHRVRGDDGFFMLMMAPTANPELAQVIAKDITFVFDTSGSMSGEKIRQARDALRYCVTRLNKGDRFNIVRFSTDVDSFSPGLVPVTDDSRTDAIAFIDRLEARGGTDVNSALCEALGTARDPKRPYIVACLTDGMPTIGVTDTTSILKNVEDGLGENTRIFVFGVGENVNTHLLDQVAAGGGGMGQYVKPGEDIEVAVSTFYDKVSHPVLDNVRVTIDRVKTHDLHPKVLPDLFCGGQVTVFGRYAGQGHVAITLRGTVNGAARQFVYEATFAEQAPENAFIPRLWATRKVGYLLDEIRLHGEEPELKDEVVRLSKEYGIMTPYTSYLVLESDSGYALSEGAGHAAGAARSGNGVRRQLGAWFAEGQVRERGSDGGASTAAATGTAGTVVGRGARKLPGVGIPVFDAADRAVAHAPGLEMARTASSNGDQARLVAPEPEAVQSYFEGQAGRAAVELSEAIARYKNTEDASVLRVAAVRHVGKRLFYRVGEGWVDRNYRPGMAVRTLPYASTEYFAYVEQHAELRQCFALGVRVVICLDDGTAIVVE